MGKLKKIEFDYRATVEQHWQVFLTCACAPELQAQAGPVRQLRRAFYAGFIVSFKQTQALSNRMTEEEAMAALDRIRDEVAAFAREQIKACLPDMGRG